MYSKLVTKSWQVFQKRLGVRVLVFLDWGSSIYRGGGLVFLHSVSNSIKPSAEVSFSEFFLRTKPVLK